MSYRAGDRAVPGRGIGKFGAYRDRSNLITRFQSFFIFCCQPRSRSGFGAGAPRRLTGAKRRPAKFIGATLAARSMLRR
uniref:Uncharacterized protein n=1 Tax=Mycobacterium riyadhense TaxID=486698 RepID=A0A653F4P8_9MYCO|nr:hypothetical protein BIN_B_05687 [Mycobacterium riyadhense]